MARGLIIVLDSVGCGGARDAADYGDEGADTLGHIAAACAAGQGDREGLRQGPLNLPNLDRLGLGLVMHASTGRKPPGFACRAPTAQWGYAVETSRGKDTPSGHWEIAGTPVLDAWYRALLIDSETAGAIGLGAEALEKAGKALTHAAVLISIGRGEGATPTIKDAPPLVYHPPANEAAGFRQAVEAMLADYAATLIPERRTLFQRYRLADAAYKVVGVGSVGTLCGVLMMVSGDGEALYLQFKEATRSVLEAHVLPSPYAHHGERVVRGQRLLQAASDIFLGYATGPTGRQMYVRQLRDAKIKPQIESMSPRTLRRYAKICGEVLAHAHARTGDAVVLSAYLGKGPAFDEAIGAFAMAYARQTEKDHVALLQAIKEGRVPDAEQDS